MKRIILIGSVIAVLAGAGAAQAQPMRWQDPPPLDFVAANSAMLEQLENASIGAEVVSRDDDAGTMTIRYMQGGQEVGVSATAWGLHLAEPPAYARFDGRLTGSVTNWWARPEFQRILASAIPSAQCAAAEKTLTDLIALHLLGLACSSSFGQAGIVTS
jgi:hypothetical protein